MLIVMKAHATEEQVRSVCRKIESLGLRAHSIPGTQRTAIGITGNETELDSGTFDEMVGVQEVIRVSRRWPRPNASPAPEQSSSAEAPTSRALRRIHFKAWLRTASRSWPRSA